jgi:alpha,alpha-trehalose phosphorylase
MAAEVGLMQLAHDYLGEAALMDLNDLEHNVRDGVHMGSLAGAWIAVVAGLGGMRHHGDALSFAPRLPPAIPRVTFRLTFLGRLIKVRISHTRVTYTLVRGRPIEFDHHGQPIRLASRSSISRSIPTIKPPRAPKQPESRAPARRAKAGPRPRTLRPAHPPKSRLPKPKQTSKPASAT